MNKNAKKGFSLIELMITVAIIGILAAIAYPSYTEYVNRGNRTEGQAFLSDVAARQERYYSQNNTYTTDPVELGLVFPEEIVESATKKYRLGLADGGGGYILTATSQFNDTKCLTLTLNARGETGSTGSRGDNKECWR